MLRCQKTALDRKDAVFTLASSVRNLRDHFHARVAIVALLLVAWVIFTNHCALGMMPAAAQAAQKSERCCGGEKNPKHDAPDGLRDCCNIKVTTAPAKTEVHFDPSKIQLHFLVVRQWCAAQVAKPEPAFPFDHGPPRVRSFAESVLQRSLLSHAPPFAV